jgi:predicted nucleic acid-binding Zn finger protein
MAQQTITIDEIHSAMDHLTASGFRVHLAIRRTSDDMCRMIHVGYNCDYFTKLNVCTCNGYWAMSYFNVRELPGSHCDDLISYLYRRPHRWNHIGELSEFLLGGQIYLPARRLI